VRERAKKEYSSLGLTTKAVADPKSHLLRRESKQRGKRDDREEREDKDEGVGLMRELESPGDRDEDELEMKRGDENDASSQLLFSPFPASTFEKNDLLTMTFNQLAVKMFLMQTLQVKPASLASFLRGEKRSLKFLRVGWCSSP